VPAPIDRRSFLRMGAIGAGTLVAWPLVGDLRAARAEPRTGTFRPRRGLG
jgi:hypothetical protein